LATKRPTAESVKSRFDSEEDYAYSRVAGDSLAALVERYPDGVPLAVRALACGNISADGKADLQAMAAEEAAIVLKLRALMGLTEDDLAGEDEDLLVP